MTSDFDLIITADYPNRTAELRLLDGHGSQLAFKQADFKDIAVGRQQGLFDPDVDRDLFLDLAWLYPEHAERTTLYASDADLPVHLSAKLHDAPRAGYYEPYTVTPGVDTVAVPDFDVDLLGHAYFARAEALLHDIYDLMRHGAAPAQRQRLAPAVSGSGTYWKLRR